MNFVDYSVQNYCAHIRLNRPDKKNALNAIVVQELTDAFDRAAADEQVRIVELTGTGNVFCSGADLEYIQQMQHFTFEENLADSRRLMVLYKKIYTHPKITIAKVNGHAIAGGSGLVTVCDFAFSVSEANYGYTETRIGFIPAIVMVFLLKKMQESKIKELLYTGKIIRADEAKSLGIIHHTLDGEEELKKYTEDFISKLCSDNSFQSIRQTKKLLLEINAKDLDASLELAAKNNAEMRMTEDCKKGIASFLNKQKPDWK